MLNSKLDPPDPFVMNEDRVNLFIASFLESRGFNNVKFLTGHQPGVDVSGQKNGWDISVESKGSHGNNHNDKTVFKPDQILKHLHAQIGKLMEYKNENKDNALIAMGNPDIPRIRRRMKMVEISLDLLGFIRLWVQEDGTVKVEYPVHLRDNLVKLNLI